MVWSGRRGRRRARAGQARRAADAGIEVLQVRPNVFLLAGAGGNVVAHVGNDGVILVDAGSGAKTDAVLRSIAALTDKPIRYIINTGPDADHVGGNARLSMAGKPLGGGGQPFTLTGASIIAAENVLDRMSAPTGQSSPYPVEAWPLETFTTREKVLRLNHDAESRCSRCPRRTPMATASCCSAGPTSLPRATSWTSPGFRPSTWTRAAASRMAALNRLIELAIPSVPLPAQQEDTLIIPGHGRVGMQADVVDYRDMVTIVRDRGRGSDEEPHDARANHGGGAHARMEPRGLRARVGASLRGRRLWKPHSEAARQDGRAGCARKGYEEMSRAMACLVVAVVPGVLTPRVQSRVVAHLSRMARSRL